jgi:hypothetical protein
VWQDASNIVRDSANPSKTATQSWLEKKEGEGGDDFFSISVPYNAANGNFVVVLRKKDDNGVVEDRVLWSWHLWVTNYNPDEKKNHIIDGRKFTYSVPGGQVERYGGTTWGYDINGSHVDNNWHNYTYNPASTAAYAKSFMMDRALGANTAVYPRFNDRYRIQSALHYQFGRKDPIPANAENYLYNAAGTAIGKTSTAGFQAQKWTTMANRVTTAITMARSVEEPMAFVDPGIYIDWASDASGLVKNSTIPEDTYAWHDQQVMLASNLAENYMGKSIHDPCPPGWRVPANGAWQDFRDGTLNIGGHGRGENFGYWSGSNANIIRYWPRVENAQGEFPVEGTIYCPLLGYRSANVIGMGTYLHYMMVNPSMEDKAASPKIYSVSTEFSRSGTTIISGATGTYRYYGRSVRCVSIGDNENI